MVNSRDLHLTVIVLLRGPVLVAKPLNVSMLPVYLRFQPADVLVLVRQLCLLTSSQSLRCSALLAGSSSRHNTPPRTCILASRCTACCL